MDPPPDIPRKPRSSRAHKLKQASPGIRDDKAKKLLKKRKQSRNKFNKDGVLNSENGYPLGTHEPPVGSSIQARLQVKLKKLIDGHISSDAESVSGSDGGRSSNSADYHSPRSLSNTSSAASFSSKTSSNSSTYPKAPEMPAAYLSRNSSNDFNSSFSEQAKLIGSSVLVPLKPNPLKGSIPSSAPTTFHELSTTPESDISSHLSDTMSPMRISSRRNEANNSHSQKHSFLSFNSNDILSGNSKRRRKSSSTQFTTEIPQKHSLAPRSLHQQGRSEDLQDTSISEEYNGQTKMSDNRKQRRSRDNSTSTGSPSKLSVDTRKWGNDDQDNNKLNSTTSQRSIPGSQEQLKSLNNSRQNSTSSTLSSSPTFFSSSNTHNTPSASRDSTGSNNNTTPITKNIGFNSPTPSHTLNTLDGVSLTLGQSPFAKTGNSFARQSLPVTSSAISDTLTPPTKKKLNNKAKNKKLKKIAQAQAQILAESHGSSSVLSNDKSFSYSLNKDTGKNSSGVLHTEYSPEFLIDPSSVTTELSVADLRDLVLYMMIPGSRAPTWVGIKQNFAIPRVVCVYIPSLTPSAFSDSDNDNSSIDINNIQPQKFSAPSNLNFFEQTFSHVFVVSSPGNRVAVFSPTDSFLWMMPNALERKTLVHGDNGRKTKNDNLAKRGRKCEPIDLILSLEELVLHRYPIHPDTIGVKFAADSNLEILQSPGPEWVDTAPHEHQDDLRPKVFAIDCEMCKSYDKSVLTRVTVINMNGDSVIDELVMPDVPITDYVTQFSGITPQMLENVETRLKDVQERILNLISSTDIMVGHSLENDLDALKIRHPRIIDTAVSFHNINAAGGLYPHQKPSLRNLTKHYLKRSIQTGGSNGHDSAEDALACLDLLKLKLKHGATFGHGDNAGKISLADRLAAADPKGASSLSVPSPKFQVAAVDYGVPYWASASAQDIMSCSNDDEIVRGVIKASQNHAFTWARMRELELMSEAIRGPRKGRGSFVSSINPSPALGLIKKEESTSKEEEPTVKKQALAAKEQESTVKEQEYPVKEEGSDIKDEEVIDVDSSDSSDSSSSSSSSDDDSDSDVEMTDKQTQSADNGNEGTTASTTKPQLSTPAFNLQSATSEAYSRLNERLKSLYTNLPKNTALVIWTGQGDKQRMLELHAKRQQFNYEYKTKKWSDITAVWTDEDVRELAKATEKARKGLAFVAIKNGL